MIGAERLREALRLWTAVCLLLLVAVLFRQPLTDQVVPRVMSSVGGDGAGRAAPGFVVRVTTSPAGVGTVWIADRERGPVPFFGNVRCTDGEPVRIEVRATGFESWARTIACRDGGSLEITARLDRPRADD